MSKIADTLRVLAVALPGFVLLPQAAADGDAENRFYQYRSAFIRNPSRRKTFEMTLEKEFKKPSKPLAKLQQEGEALERKLSSDKLSDSQRKRKPKMAQSGTEISASSRPSWQRDYNLRRNEEFAALQQNANRVIVDLAKREGYDFILQDVIYVNGRYADITDSSYQSPKRSLTVLGSEYNHRQNLYRLGSIPKPVSFRRPDIPFDGRYHDFTSIHPVPNRFPNLVANGKAKIPITAVSVRWIRRNNTSAFTNLKYKARGTTAKQA